MVGLLLTLILLFFQGEAQSPGVGVFDCVKKADIYFIIDTSDPSYIPVMQNFAKAVVNRYNVGPNYVRFGLITFGHIAHIDFNLKQRTTKRSVLLSLGNLPSRIGARNTHQALQKVRDEGFNLLNGNRPDVENYVIIIITGPSDDHVMTVSESIRNRNRRILSLAIGVNNTQIASELRDLANPYNYNVQDLMSISDIIADATCEIYNRYNISQSTTQSTSTGSPSGSGLTTGSGGSSTTIPPTPTTATLTTSTPSRATATISTPSRTTATPNRTIATPSRATATASQATVTTVSPPSQTATTVSTPSTNITCQAKTADVVLVIDSSSSISLNDWGLVKKFMERVIDIFQIGPQYTRVGLIRFNDDAELVFPLNQHQNKQELLAAIRGLHYKSGGTNTAAALAMMNTRAFLQDRTGVPNIAIVMTDGRSKVPRLTAYQASIAHGKNTHVFAIGVGDEVMQSELEAIASDPDQSHVFTVNNFTALQEIVISVTQRSCGVLHTTATTTIGSQVTGSGATGSGGTGGSSQTGSGGSNTTATDSSQTGATTTAAPVCADKDDCLEKDVCSDYSESYAREHCQKTCGYCNDTQGNQACEDLEHCSQYGTYICWDMAMFQFALKSCKKFCGFCPGDTPQTPAPPTTQAPTVPTTEAPCEDAIDCTAYGAVSYVCGGTFGRWAAENCRRYCGLCPTDSLVRSNQTAFDYKCPDWKLPVNCTLVHYENSCCPMPSCPPNFTLKIMRPKPH